VKLLQVHSLASSLPALQFIAAVVAAAAAAFNFFLYLSCKPVAVPDIVKGSTSSFVFGA
jgi:hypothetical protein